MECQFVNLSSQELKINIHIVQQIWDIVNQRWNNFTVQNGSCGVPYSLFFANKIRWHLVNRLQPPFRLPPPWLSGRENYFPFFSTESSLGCDPLGRNRSPRPQSSQCWSSLCPSVWARSSGSSTPFCCFYQAPSHFPHLLFCFATFPDHFFHLACLSCGPSFPILPVNKVMRKTKQPKRWWWWCWWWWRHTTVHPPSFQTTSK